MNFSMNTRLASNKPASLQVSPLGLGTSTLASLRGGLSVAESDRLLATASEGGIKLIDTADSYASGECERLLGRLLRHRRDAFQVMTKAGYTSADLRGPLHHLNPFLKKLKHKLGARQDFRPERIGYCLRRSLQRLRADHVAIFVLHDPPAEALVDGTLFAELTKLKAAGLAARLGISSGDDDALRLALAWPDCEVIQTPLIGEGGLAAPLREAGPGRPCIVLNHVSLGGRLPGTERDADSVVLPWRDKITRRAAELGVGPHGALLRVALEETGAEAVLTGTRHPGHLADNCRAVMALSNAGS
jgi:aryl-alcohol dehydrogenase-like predicted oxidoreductase